jgi:hypothetical protein
MMKGRRGDHWALATWSGIESELVLLTSSPPPAWTEGASDLNTAESPRENDSKRWKLIKLELAGPAEVFFEKSWPVRRPVFLSARADSSLRDPE